MRSRWYNKLYKIMVVNDTPLQNIQKTNQWSEHFPQLPNVNLIRKNGLFFHLDLSHSTCDKFNMSYGNNRLPQPPFYSGQPPNFVPWSHQTNPIMNFPHPFGHMPPLTSPFLPPNFLIQQQNNYFNSTITPPSHYMPNIHSQMLSSTLNPFIPWQARPTPPKHSNMVVQQQAKRTPEVICLDEEPMDNVVVIEDSEQQKRVVVSSKKDEKVKSMIVAVPVKLQVDKQIKQRDVSCEAKKNESSCLPQKRQNRNAKYSVALQISKKQPEVKLNKKKSIVKDRFVYRLSAHEKQLSQLSEYRDFFPHQTVTGPQFQAKLPHLRLFGRAFGGLKERDSWLGVRRQKLLQRLQSVQSK